MAKQINYTEEFRRAAVDMYKKGNESAAQLARKIGIHEHTMCRWIELYGKSGGAAPHAAVESVVLAEGHCIENEHKAIHPYALEYIHAIKRHIDALEQLILSSRNEMKQ